MYCYNCLKKTIFTNRDVNHNSGVEFHCSECVVVWFEWQNRAVELEKEKWLEYNGVLVKKLKSTIQSIT